MSEAVILAVLSALDKRLSDIDDKTDRRHEENERRLDSMVRKLDKVEVTGEATLLQATKTNGRVTEIEDWRELHDREHAREENIAIGEQRKVDEIVGRVNFLGDFMNRYWKTVGLIAFGLDVGWRVYDYIR